MDRRHFLIAPACLALAACAGQGATPLTADDRRALRLGTVEVLTAATLFEGAGAEARRNEVGPDLRARLRSEFADRLDPPGGWALSVELSSLSVIGGTATALGRDRSEMVGTVRVVDPEGRLRATVPVTVVAGEARETIRGTLVGAATGRRGRFYRSLLDQFAREARRLILGDDLPGERLARRVGQALDG